jgi:hypothetical protein
VQQPAKQVGDERRRLGRPPGSENRNFARRLGELDLPDAEPVLDRRRRATPVRAKRPSGVSWYVDVKTLLTPRS